MIEVPLSRGKIALIDAEDAERVLSVKWTFHSQGYAYRVLTDKRSLLMHRFVMDAPAGVYVDHINHNRLDNRKENLRLCTNAQNQHNRKQPADGYKGVYCHRGRNKPYQAKIKVNGSYFSCGYYHTPEEAAAAYNEAALRYFGEFACYNKIGS